MLLDALLWYISYNFICWVTYSKVVSYISPSVE